MEDLHRLVLSVLLFFLSSAPFGQTGVSVPCAYRAPLLRGAGGELTVFSSSEMKGRATHKVELGGFLRQADIKGTAVVDVLVGPAGEVVCLRVHAAHPLIRTGVEKTLKSWTFELATVQSKPVAYLGRLEFNLCNILCGEQGPSMTLLK